MSIYYLVTPEQFKELTKNSKPHYMNKEEKKSLEDFYKQIEDSFKK